MQLFSHDTDCLYCTAAHLASNALLPGRRYVREGAYAPQWQKIDENRWPGTPTGRAGRGPSIDIQKAMNETRFVGVRQPCIPHVALLLICG